MPIYDFRCTLGHLSEHLLPIGTGAIACDVCGNPAPRSPANRISWKGPEVDTRGMFRRYQDATAEIDHAASKIEANTGQTVRAPDFWGAAKQRAAAVERAGENPLPPRRDT